VRTRAHTRAPLVSPESTKGPFKTDEQGTVIRKKRAGGREGKKITHATPLSLSLSLCLFFSPFGRHVAPLARARRFAAPADSPPPPEGRSIVRRRPATIFIALMRRGGARALGALLIISNVELNPYREIAMSFYGRIMIMRSSRGFHFCRD